MKDEKDKLDNTPDTEEQEIDLLELARKLWDSRKLILKFCLVGVVVGLVVAFSIPKEYTTTIELAPGKSESLGLVCRNFNRWKLCGSRVSSALSGYRCVDSIHCRPF